MPPRPGLSSLVIVSLPLHTRSPSSQSSPSYTGLSRIQFSHPSLIHRKVEESFDCLVHEAISCFGEFYVVTPYFDAVSKHAMSAGLEYTEDAGSIHACFAPLTHRPDHVE